MRLVGLTGGIVTGKSAVSNLFKAYGIPVIDADLIACDALMKGSGGWKKVMGASGEGILQANGEVAGAKLGQIVCSDSSRHHLLTRYSKNFSAVNFQNPWWVFRHFSHSTTNFVISEGIAKFESKIFDPPPKKWKTTKKLKLHRKREKQKKKAANRRDPRHLGIKGDRKRKFANAEERLKYKLEKARIKEALLIERLKRYEVSKLQGPLMKAVDMTGEERFFMKKMAQKSSNYVPVGKRGIFGGVILNMHMHWKKHETVKVICKPCKPGQVQEYANEIARLSGGIPIQVIGNNTIIFYRGKDYVQPEVMSPIDTLSKKRALEKSKYEQSLDSVRHFIAIAEKELELYYRHIALYGEPNRDMNTMLDSASKLNGDPKRIKKGAESSTSAGFHPGTSDMDSDSMHEVSDKEDDFEDDELSLSDSDLESENEGMARNESDSCEEGIEYSSPTLRESKSTMFYC